MGFFFVRLKSFIYICRIFTYNIENYVRISLRYENRYAYSYSIRMKEILWVAEYTQEENRI